MNILERERGREMVERTMCNLECYYELPHLPNKLRKVYILLTKGHIGLHLVLMLGQAFKAFTLASWTSAITSYYTNILN